MTLDHQRLLEDFRTYYEKQPPSPIDHKSDLPEFWAVSQLDELAHEDPDTAWLLILTLLGQDLPDIALGCLAAGPLEDLIQYHGPNVIDRIECEAQENPKFRHLLGGVWESSTPDVWGRVVAARGEPW